MSFIKNRREFLRNSALWAMAVPGFHGLKGGPALGETTAAQPAKPVVVDSLQPLPPGSIRLRGFVQDRIQQQADLSFDAKTLAAMADVFRKRANGFADGEFWGKAVRALCHHYQYSSDCRLKELIEATASDLLTTQTPDGCLSEFAYPMQPKNSDLWDRKYAMLGLLGCYDVTQDPKILQALIRMTDYTLAQVGPPPKTRIVDTGWAFEGIESSSILEPMVRLHQVTGFERYLDFARYIVEVEGGCKRGSIFEAAFQGKDVKDFGSNGHPDQSIAKAYESQSCFEGLVEYYRATGNPHWRQAALNFYTNVLAKETTIIGSGCGLGGVNNGIAPTEQFNYSGLYQTCPVREGIEGCQSARWMTYCSRLLRLTGDSTIADQFERTLYNALLGSIRPDGQAVDYHTHLNGTKPAKINFQKPFNGKLITCCFYNVVDSLALVPSVAVMTAEGGPVINLYIPATANVKLAGNNEVVLEQTTDYPRDGEINILVRPLQPARFPIRLRIPAWSRNTVVKVNGEAWEAKSGSYCCIDRTWAASDRISLVLEMRGRLERSPEGSPTSSDAFRALTRGPIVLARDKRLGADVHEEVEIQAGADGYVALTPMALATAAHMQFAVPTTTGGSFPVIDFASAGNTWDAQSEYVTWIPRPATRSLT